LEPKRVRTGPKQKKKNFEREDQNVSSLVLSDPELFPKKEIRKEHSNCGNRRGEIWDFQK
jgi:hypothetical protein